MPSRALLVLALLMGSLAVAGWGPTPAASPPPGEFAVAVQFLEKHCLGCHGARNPKAGLNLLPYRDESQILKGRRTWNNVLHMVRSGEMPPRSRPRPQADELEAFTKSVNAAFTRAEKNAKPDPGRVTIRRLNRYEYNNTIRDLVGVDFNPAEDFPSDDIGHGFDNIGDVLSLPPVLLERYLAAAESIMQRAIVPNPPKPPVRRLSARYLEPGGVTVPTGRFRAVSAGNAVFYTNQLTLDGEYLVRSRVYGQADGDEPLRVALTADGVELKTFVIEARNDKAAQRIEAPVRLDPGRRRVGLTFLNEKRDGRNPIIHVEYLEVEGPADTRPASHRRLLAVDAQLPPRERTRVVMERFASRAYRRPATREEVDRLVQLVEAAESRGRKWEAAIQFAMQAVLVSPKFLFRVELDDRPDTPQPHPIDEYQLASRLSYFLWSSMPDDELFELAAKKQLTANLEAQVRRMLKDPKAAALTESFAMQWLQLRRLQTFTPDPELFPNFNEPLRQAMLKETQLFFLEIIREDRSILDLIDADFTYVNEPLARHYGIDSTGEKLGPKTRNRAVTRQQGFIRVNLKDGERGGILTQASVLTVTSNPTRTSPVKRGRWLLEQILGTPPPPPPPDVPELAEDAKAHAGGSLRQRMEQHRANPACASCHARMDPLGFAFENYNAIGAWRSQDGDFPIDASGTLPDGRSFKGPAELKAILKEQKDLFSRNLAEKMLVYALGRGVEYYDQPTLTRITESLARNDYRFSTLVVEIVKSDPFRLRRGKGQD